MQTLALESHHIVDLFVLIDDMVEEPARPQGGRPKLARDSEIITLLIWNCLSRTRQRTLKDIFKWALMYHRRDVPKLGTYGAFVAHCHRLLPQLRELLGQVLAPAEVQLVDSTKLPVCRNHRKDRYKVAAGLAGWGKNWQGFWFGFKLHAAVDLEGRLSAVTFTPADVYDGHVTPDSSDRRLGLWWATVIMATRLPERSSGKPTESWWLHQFTTDKAAKQWLHGSKSCLSPE